ncbi:MAG: hypothetical protein K2O18_10435 [Oscillospiraceae bacterium]|nr:hypothetical protein [Oscillospiraceae bacterium]
MLSFSGCSRTKPAAVKVPDRETASGTVPEPAESGDNPPAEEEAGETVIALTVGEQSFSAALLDNETAKEFAAMPPITLNMSELNGNEKYFYMDNRLSTQSEQPGQIHTGDLMLYGDSCLVLFYDTFSSGYSYTRLGRVDDPSGLAETLGTGNVTVTFSLEG